MAAARIVQVMSAVGFANSQPMINADNQEDSTQCGAGPSQQIGKEENAGGYGERIFGMGEQCMQWRKMRIEKAPADAHAAQDVPIFWRLAYSTQRTTETNVPKNKHAP